MESLAVPDPSLPRVRSWRVPPPLTRGAELLEGVEVLSEISDSAGGLLWKSLRNVTLWASAIPRDAGGLFADGARERRLAELHSAALDDEIRKPLEALTSILSDPERTAREPIALACQRIAQWAEVRGASATALAFVQAAALACPRDPRLAFAVGRLARQRAENARSESWFRRAIMLARQLGDWETYALAYLGLGNLFFQRGSFPNARRAHVKGLRAARRKGLREIVGRAYHDLMAIEIECENAARAQDYAASALRAYGTGHPRLPALAHDTAALWVLQGEFGRALPVFQAVLPSIERPHERLVVMSNLARAAAGAGRAQLFAESWELVWAATAEVGPGVAQALLNLAHGASLLGQWERAEEAAARSAHVATERGEAQIRFEVDALLDAVRHRRTLQVRLQTLPAGPAPGEGADALAAKLIRSMGRATAGV